MYQPQNENLDGHSSRTNPRVFMSYKAMKDAGEEPNPLVFCKITNMSPNNNNNSISGPSTSAIATSQESPEINRVARRQRGRPRGNPPKLTPEQKRQRNAQLERERRGEINEAYEELQGAVTEEYRAQFAACEGGDPELSRANLLQSAIMMISQEEQKSGETEELRQGVSFIKNEIETYKRLLQRKT